jgi:hypothetical protein
MQKVVGVYLIFLVVGAIIGASVVTFVTMSQNPSIKEQVKVTIQGIDYTSSDSVLKIELLNNVPETNLEGKVIVSQDDNQWTSDVTWYYTGHGEVEVICDSIDETQNFRITYNENYPEATYLDRIIEWNEITINQGSTSSQAGAILSTENVRFYSADDIEISIRNSGTADAKIVEVYQGPSTSELQKKTVTSYDPTTQIVSAGSSITIEIRLDDDWESGTRYYFKVVTEEGYNLPFSAEAPYPTSIPFMETSELTITQMTFDDSAETIACSVTNSGTSAATVSLVKVNGATESSVTGDTSYAAGASGTLTITITDVVAGNKYSVSLFASDGTLIGSYTDTA